MASLSREPNGSFRIQFIDATNKRRSIRLGAIPKKAAESVKLRVEQLAALQQAKLPMDTETARWVGEIGDDLAGKLAAVGLIATRQRETLGGFLNAYLDRRKAGGKPNTVTNIEQVVNDLLGAFDPKGGLRHFTRDHAEQFRARYQANGLASATVHRRLKFTKTMFTDAVRRNMIPSNPFADVKAPNKIPLERRAYVTAADTLQLMLPPTPRGGSLWRCTGLPGFGVRPKCSPSSGRT